MRLEGRTVLLTGASGGIGAAVARYLAAKGAQLLLTGRNEAALNALRDELIDRGASAHICVADLAEQAGRQRIANWIRVNRWPLSVLINNAGLNDFVCFERQSPARIEQVMHTNLVAPMLLIHQLLPLLQGQDEALIVNVGSTLGALGHPGYVTYCASKFGVRGFSEALARELDGSGVRVAYVSPRAVATGLNDDRINGMNAELGNAVDSPEWVAEQIGALISGNARQCQLGRLERLFVRLNAWFPGLVDRAVRKQMPVIRAYLDLPDSRTP
jgi:short-subunit dehydrogenase